MIWKVLDRTATVAYLILSTILIAILMSNSSDNANVNNYGQKLTLVRQDIMKVVANNTDYLEQRVNKTSERQDDYQVSTDQRIYVLELRVKELQGDKKLNQKIVNNNINTLTNN
jgi:predicted FMN-binding regulatory protein PaiB